MKKLHLPLVLLLFILGVRPSVKAQITLSPADTTLCPGDSYTINGSFATDFGNITIDDVFGGVVNIGFDFVFYGDTVNQCVISANNFLSFNLAHANQGSTWVYSSAVGNGQIANAIMFPFQDVNMGAGGNIYYQTLGAAPNRRFVVQFCKCPMFDCLNILQTNEVILYEGSNIIEMHITTNQACLTWQSGTGIQGLRHNGLEDLVPGRNLPNTPWNTTNDAHRFTPNGSTGYIIDTIAYNPIPILQNVNANNIVWYEEGNPNPIGNGASINVTVTTGVNYYLATISGQTCDNQTALTVVDTAWIHSATLFDTLDVDICAGETYDFFGRQLNYTGFFDTAFRHVDNCDTFIRLNLHVNPLPIPTLTDTTSDQIICKGGATTLALAQPSANYTYEWERDSSILLGQNSSSYTALNEGVYRIIITTDKGCVDSSKYISLKIDTVDIDINPVPLLGCGTDTIQIVNNSESGQSYFWTWGDNSYPPDTTREPRHLYQQQGTYLIHYVMTNNNGCVDSTSAFVDLNHPKLVAFAPNQDSLCQGSAATVQFNNQSVGNTNYFWDFDDGSPISTQTNPNHHFNRAGSYQVMLVGADGIPCYDTAYHTIYVDSLDQPLLSVDKHHFCVGEEVQLNLSYYEQAKNVNWDFADGTSWDELAHQVGHHYHEPGNYVITSTVSYLKCPPLLDTVHIAVHHLPYVDLGRDTVLCLQGDPIFLENKAAAQNEAGVRYQWSTGDSGVATRIRQPGEYWLKASIFDCSTTEHLVVNKDCYLDIPNAFTPNGDGVNDYFLPRQLLSKGVSNFHMMIYNRWGQRVFETNSVNGRGWDGRYDGKDQGSGVYVYQIEVTYKNGNKESYSGNVTLVR